MDPELKAETQLMISRLEETFNKRGWTATNVSKQCFSFYLDRLIYLRSELSQYGDRAKLMVSDDSRDLVNATIIGTLIVLQREIDMTASIFKDILLTENEIEEFVENLNTDTP